MKSFEELDALCDAALKYKLPKTHMLFLNDKELRETRAFFKSLPNKCMVSCKLPDDEIQEDRLTCDHFWHGSFTFYLIPTEYCDPIPHLHDWVESKAYFNEDTYSLIRHCQSCLKTETFDDKYNRWSETGYFKSCISSKA